MKGLEADVLIVGGGTGGCAAALAAASAGCRVVMTEPGRWLGGQLTSQMVPPDEHWAIDRYGGTGRYRLFREGVRRYYRDFYPLTPDARMDPRLNPGGGTVSGLCFEPKVGVAVLEQMMAPYILRGKLKVLHHYTPAAAQVSGDRIESVLFRNGSAGNQVEVKARYFLDATELGDLLPLSGAEYRTGAESVAQTGEPSALADGPDPENVQAFTWCMPLAFDPICPEESDQYYFEKPATYEFWKNFLPKLQPGWGGPLLGKRHPHPVTLQPMTRCLFEEPGCEGRPLWLYRRIVTANHYPVDSAIHEVTVMNWPQNDYFLRNIIDKPDEEMALAYEEARQLSLSLAWWLQREYPREDGRTGYAGLYLRPDISGTDDGLAPAPYIREARRMKGKFLVTENHIGVRARNSRLSERFSDAVGVGYYRIDLHPTTGGRNYLDLEAAPFQVPLGALLPERLSNLVAAGKCLSVSHIANGCYRLHPVEWNIGESAGALAAFCLQHKVEPNAVREDAAKLEEFQNDLMRHGVDLEWPSL